MLKVLPTAILLSATTALVTAAATAVAIAEPVYWTVGRDASFDDGSMTGLAVTDGTLELGWNSGDVAPVAPRGVATGFARLGDQIIGTTAYDGGLFRLDDDVAIEMLPLDVQASVESNAGLIVAGGGDAVRLLRVSGDNLKAEPFATIEDAMQAWDLVAAGDGFLVATGPAATLYRVTNDGGAEPIFTADNQQHLTSIVVGDKTYVGTSPGGQVWNVQDNRVVFDAAEAEIVELISTPAGLLVVASDEPVSSTDLEANPAVVNPAGNDLPEADVELPEAIDEDVDDDGNDDLPEPIDGVDGAAGDDSTFAGQSPANRAAGGSVYRIDADDGVTQLYRSSAPLLAATLVGDDLVLLAGVDADAEESIGGRVERLSLSTGRVSTLLAMDDATPSAIMADGNDLLVGTSMPVTWRRLSPATSGTWTSPAIDAGRGATFGSIELRGSAGGTIQVQTRSGDTEPDSPGETNPAGWSDWTEPKSAERFVASDLEPARFAQVRVILTADDNGAAGGLTSLRLAYDAANQPPIVSNLSIDREIEGLTAAEIAEQIASANQGASEIVSATWEAADPNGDALVYDLLIRRDRRGAFRPLVTGLDESAYAWNAHQLGDGVFELKVVARESAGESAGQSAGQLRAELAGEPFRVDLTPPTIGDLKFDGTTASFRVADRGSFLVRVDAMTGTDPSDPADWTTIAPGDGLADSPSETFAIDLGDRAELSVRAIDSMGNLSFATLRRRVKLPAGMPVESATD